MGSGDVSDNGDMRGDESEHDQDGSGFLSSNSVSTPPLPQPVTKPVTVTVTEALLSSIAREAPHMNAQVRGLARYIVLDRISYIHTI